ncbi:MAG TPA: Gldg family protein [Isosphaeraceae bacterium]|jgi:ABC-2 type transport system permease protein|nr:Gldg family protein [Isosphaeraceae bacterium]
MGKRSKHAQRKNNPAQGGRPEAGRDASTATTAVDERASDIETIEAQALDEPPPRRAPAPLRPHVVAAVCGRDFLGYFSNPAGYVFITAFVLVSSWFAFCEPAFFANNLANLDSLNEWMPYLLLFFVPAVTMSMWAEERRQGTEELLLTLPARDVEVVLGKYLAALGIYTVALLFSLSHVAILYWLGKPDPGVMAANYLGFWLMGAMLIPIGMVASLLSSSATVGFILGAVFCAVVVFAGRVGSLVSSWTWLAERLGTKVGPQLQRLIQELSIPSQFRPFGTGVVPLSGVVYFATLAAGVLYLMMVLLGRRHWAGGRRSAWLWAHSTARVVAVGVALVSLNVLVGRGLSQARADVSVEQLSTLSPESRKVLRALTVDKPVVIQAFYSPDVPSEFVPVKNELLNKLREYAALAGSDKIRLNLVETDRYSQPARDAEKRFGIEARPVRATDEARTTAQEIYLGAAFTCGLEEIVIPFFDPGLPVEYELTRSIRVVSGAGRKKVGILNTDAKIMGGFDMRTMGRNNEWQIVTELKKQYDVTSVSADAEIPTDLQVLLVAQASGLSQRQIDNLTAYVRRGGPTLLMMDPLTFIDPSLSASEPRQPPGGPFGGGAQVEPKGSLAPLLQLLGVDFPADQIVWNAYNPVRRADFQYEFVFVDKGSGADEPFNPRQSVSSGLQRIVMLAPGLLRPRHDPDAPKFTPLLRTNDNGGVESWEDVVQRGMMGISGMTRERRYIPTRETYTLAALIQGKAPAAKDEPNDADPAKKAKKAPAKPADLRVIAIADLDMISNELFDVRAAKIADLDFDNITFVLNCVDVLAGDEELVALRKRRPRHRTLEALEGQIKVFDEQRLKKQKEAEEEAKAAIDKAQKELDANVAKIRGQKELDARTRDLMISQVEAVENRRLNSEVKANIEDKKRREIFDSKAEAEQAIRRKQNEVKAMAVALPPLLPALLGLGVFGVRVGRENRGANPNRLA